MNTLSSKAYSNSLQEPVSVIASALPSSHTNVHTDSVSVSESITK